MLSIWQKIISTGNVTENWDQAAPPERSRGEVVVRGGITCQDCQSCIKACPVGAIKHTAGTPVIDNKACVFCGLCVDACKAGCLEQTTNYELSILGASLEEAGSALSRKIRSVLGRSLHVRHLDIGGCNACDFELNHLTNPIYDVQQYGIDFVASPRHADMVLVTGPVTRNSTQALLMTYEAMATPKLVMAVGACACSGQVFGASHAIRGAVDSQVPVDIYVPGCPPRPQAIIQGLMLALDRM